MDINISTPAIIFPTISLFMIAYTNRFSALVNRIRELSEKDLDKNDSILKQISYLEKRVQLVILMQSFLVMSMLFSVLSIFSFLFDFSIQGKYLFLISLITIAISLFFSFNEILISGKALKIQISDIKNN